MSFVFSILKNSSVDFFIIPIIITTTPCSSQPRSKSWHWRQNFSTHPFETIFHFPLNFHFSHFSPAFIYPPFITPTTHMEWPMTTHSPRYWYLSLKPSTPFEPHDLHFITFFTIKIDPPHWPSTHPSAHHLAPMQLDALPRSVWRPQQTKKFQTTNFTFFICTPQCSYQETSPHSLSWLSKWLRDVTLIFLGKEKSIKNGQQRFAICHHL